MTDEKDDLAKVLLSAGLVFVGALLENFARLAERVLIGRTVSAEAYGEFSIGLAILTLSVTSAMAGFSQGIPRYMARFDDPADERGALLTGLVVTLPIALALCAVLVLAGDVIVAQLFESVGSELLLTLFVVTIPLVITFQLGIAAIRGYENTSYKILARNVTYPGVRLLLLGTFLSLGFGVHAAGYSYLIAAIVTTLVTYVLLRRLLTLTGPSRFHIREMTAFSVPLIVSTVAATLMTKTDTLMLGYFRASSEVGIYNAAYPLANSLVVILGTFGYMYLPVASRLDGDGERESMNRVYQMTTKWVFVLTFPLFVTFVVMPSDVIALAFGQQYASGGIALAILSIGFFTNAAVGRNRETLSALGYTKFILVTNVGALGINIVANVALIPRYGFVGAAIASASSFVGLNLFVYLFLARKFDIRPYNRTSLRLIGILPLVVLPAGFALDSVFPASPTGIGLFFASTSLLTLLVAAGSGSLEHGDIVIVEFLEDALGTEIPYVRELIPDPE
ncbi:flippase [Halosolutus halophilus]|uniref:flippase n=1 Tax=Halosolutus halophilus TaxID=1552990 RepID=UPI0022350FC4|nr:flippase [Halosolutus halophilus]